MTNYSPVALRYHQVKSQETKAATQRRLFIITCLIAIVAAAWLSYKAEPTCQSLHGQTWDYSINQPIACR